MALYSDTYLSQSELLARVALPNAINISRQPGKEATHFVPSNNFHNYIHFSYGKTRVPSATSLHFATDLPSRCCHYMPLIATNSHEPFHHVFDQRRSTLSPFYQHLLLFCSH